MSRWTYGLDALPDLPAAELKELVGGKAANLGLMLGPELRLPVPPGFVVTTAACRAYLAGGWPDGLDEELARLKAESDEMKQHWQAEKEAIGAIRELMEQLDSKRAELERESDLERAAEIRYGQIPELERRVAEATEHLSEL
jgi:phosphoenolpyruvate synthase/pyruvate phosphate dikinase